MKASPSAGAPPAPGWDETYRRCEERLAAGEAVGWDDLGETVAAAREAHAAADVEGRVEVRARLGRLERLLGMACRFELADAFYRARMDLARADWRRRWREERDVGAFVQSCVYGLWRFASLYGTSPLRLGWMVFNVGFWFSVVYFVMDILAVRLDGRRAFEAAVNVSYASYFILGFEGLFPGTAAFLPATFYAQVAVALENLLGAILLLSLTTLVARRVWRGAA